MSQQIPPFASSLADILAESWRLLARGVTDRRSVFHQMTVATIGLDGRPRLRTVVLRGCDVATRKLRFHTDNRSDKINEIRRDNRVGLHFYDATAKIQLRIEGLATLHTDDAFADAAWAKAQIMSRQCYGIAPGPGTPLENGGDFALPALTDESTAAGRAFFCVAMIEVQSLEWLFLAASGHRRARFTHAADGSTSQWLAP